MIKQAHGFLLLEFTLYFFLLVFLTTLIGTVLISAHQRAHEIAKRSNAIMTQWFGVDRLVHDINHAPSSIDAWRLLDQTHIVWHHKDHDIGWKCQDNSLFRLEGTYDAHARTWLHCTQSLVAQEVVVQCIPILINERHVHGIRLHMNSCLDDSGYSRIVACEGCV